MKLRGMLSFIRAREPDSCIVLRGVRKLQLLHLPVAWSSLAPLAMAGLKGLQSANSPARIAYIAGRGIGLALARMCTSPMAPLKLTWRRRATVPALRPAPPEVRTADTLAQRRLTCRAALRGQLRLQLSWGARPAGTGLLQKQTVCPLAENVEAEE